MKKIILPLGFLFAALVSGAQSVSVNNSGLPADTSAMLDISSHTKGVLIPRMRANERTSIVFPAEGLLVYDIDTKSFWQFSNSSWKEVLNSSSTITPTGPALGDLYGTYPSPNVGKIQNLDVAFGVPLDKQILKWDGLNNRWQGQNDSLFLPYNGTWSSTAKLFGVTNNNTSNGATAVYGKSGSTGSGITPALSIGVWGDNAAGAGILGTSNSGTGLYGYSISNTGVYGFTGGNNNAGVYGSNGASGYGLMGEVFSGGTALWAKANGTTGKAVVMENTNSNNLDTVLKVVHRGSGQGALISLTNSASLACAFTINNAGTGRTVDISNGNTNSTAHLIYMQQSGKGIGMQIDVPSTLNNSAGVFIQHFGTGSGIESYGYNGKAGLFQVPSTNNSSTALSVSTLGTGNAAGFTISNATNNNAVVKVSNNGTGRGLESIITNSSSTAAAIYASSSGNNGLQAFAQATGVLGQSTGLVNGIGVLGQAALSSSSGIGVKGISYSIPYSDGSVSGINMAGGTGVYGESSSVSGSGVGVYGYTQNGIIGVDGEAGGANSNGVYGLSSGLNGVGIYGDAGQYSSLSQAAYFRNVNASNNRKVVEISNAGTGAALYMQSFNASNSAPLFWGTYGGTGAFLYFDDNSGNAKVRINNLGKGFFNGGTQTGGADMAEAFDVAGDRNAYEPGDVLVISMDGDRTVERSSKPYSDIVAGVYATKPGMLMSEENIDADLSAKVPMGVLGVIPTKVCLEGGEIHRGDFLVTSSQTGIAMKADKSLLKPGQLIGKALENFNSKGIAKIKVLVNVK